MIIQQQPGILVPVTENYKISFELEDVNSLWCSIAGKKYIRSDWTFIYSRSGPTCNRRSDELSKLAKSERFELL